MPLPPDKRRDIVWICIDSLRVDCLRVGGNTNVHPNFLDKLFNESVFFSRCLATAQGTIASAFSFFTSLAPTVTGMLTQTANCIVHFDPRAVTVTDILKRHGYSTWRYDDMCTYSCQPKSGFDHYEGGYFDLKDTPDKSFDAPRRDAFLARFNEASSPRFLYMHLDHVHEYGGVSSTVWTKQKYCRLLAEVSREVRELLKKIRGMDSAILLVNSDHGVTLDQDWAHFERGHGGVLPEARVRTFAAFRMPGTPSRRIEATVSSLDLAPTLLDLVGISDLKGQGQSLAPVMSGGELKPMPALSMWAAQPRHERHVIGGTCPAVVDSVRLSTDDWTVVRERSGPAVVTGREEGSDPGPRATATALACLAAMENCPDDPDAVYAASGQIFRKRHLLAEVSVIVPADRADENLRPCLLSLMDQVPTAEFLVLDFDATGGVRAAVEEFSDHPFLVRLDVAGLTLDRALTAALAMAGADCLALVSARYRYAENYLQECLLALRADSQAGLVYCNVYQALRDSRPDYLYIGPDFFYVSQSFWGGGCGSVLNLGPGLTGETGVDGCIGDCAVFTRRAILAAGGFRHGPHTVGDAFDRMAKASRFIHLRRPLIVAKGLLACPALGIAAAADRDAGVTAVVVLEDGTDSNKALPVLLRSLMDAARVVAEILVLVPAGQENIQALAGDDAGFACPVRILAADGPEHLRRNLAIRAARGDYLVWLRPGELFSPGSLALLAGRLDTDARAAIVCAELGGKKDAPVEVYSDLWFGPRGLTGVVYRARMHRETGGFAAYPGLAGEWDMFLRLAEAGAVAAVPGALVFPVRERFPTPELSSELIQAVLGRAAWRMNDCIDLMRLYPEVFAETETVVGVELVRRHFDLVVRQNNHILRLGKPISTVGPEKYACPTWEADDRYSRAAECL